MKKKLPKIPFRLAFLMMEPSAAATYKKLQIMFNWEDKIEKWRKDMIYAIMKMCEVDRDKKYAMKVIMALRPMPMELVELRR